MIKTGTRFDLRGETLACFSFRKIRDHEKKFV